MRFLLNAVAGDDGVEVVGFKRVVLVRCISGQSRVLFEALNGALFGVGVELFLGDTAIGAEILDGFASAVHHVFQANLCGIYAIVHQVGGKLFNQALGQLAANDVLVGQLLDLAVVAIHVVANEDEQLVDVFEVLAMLVYPAVGELRGLAFFRNLGLQPTQSLLADDLFRDSYFRAYGIHRLIRSEGEGWVCH